ncbi:hypothetical protein GQ43DRAFT_464936 [Delitschia confertaspora ATCC 74209]|uniref:Uncharacterized protein n=1 Tax=Delitschia confertaspora ATCC 74209 TaxID=1513339 RepID=A0A9P4JLE3_9PLEO|nr:hypothetical protein GQ43DRAFT_464936 [Delitschia confertaspora ATCC 74209]
MSESNSTVDMERKGTEYEHLEQEFELPPYSSTWESERERNSDNDNDKTNTFTEKLNSNVQLLRCRVAELIYDMPAYTSTATSYALPLFKNIIPTNLKSHIFAFLILFGLGITPFIILLHFIYASTTSFNHFFSSRTETCSSSGNSGFTDEPTNSTITGIEALFFLDKTFGHLTFPQAKVLDATWDLIVGRGAQLLCWYIGYRVFVNALLRVIERHPASLQTFIKLSLNGPSWGSGMALLRDLFSSAKTSLRTRVLFAYMFVSILYLLSVPTVLSAITGYVSTSTPWINADGENNEGIVPASEFKSATAVYGIINGIRNGSVEIEPTCAFSGQISEFEKLSRTRERECNCSFANGTVRSYATWRMNYYQSSPWLKNPDTQLPYNLTDCTIEYPNNTQQYSPDVPLNNDEKRYCKDPFTITINNTNIPLTSLNTSFALCRGDRPYDWADLSKRTRCLPDTSHPSYEWGFSSMLSAIFVIVHFMWSISMYIIWLDAQVNCKLVKKGYLLSQLRAVFAISVAAEQKTGFQGRELVEAERKELERELFGPLSGRKKGEEVARGAVVDKGVFGVGEEEVKVEVESANSAEVGQKLRRRTGCV